MSSHESSYMENGNTTMEKKQYKKREKWEERTLYFQQNWDNTNKVELFYPGLSLYATARKMKGKSIQHECI